MTALSVVICTHDRTDDLTACLEALATNLNGDLSEVLVVDSASPVPCRTLVDRYGDRIRGLQYLRLHDPGLSRARNAGIAAAAGEFIAFIDDDASVEPGWDQALLDAFADDPRVGCVGGACVARFAGERPAWLSDRLLQMASITRWGERPREPRSSAEWPVGANVAFRRSALADAGDFALDLGRNGATSLASGEDSEMVARILAAGWQVRLEPRARVLHTVHADRLTADFYRRRFWSGGVSRAQLRSPNVTLRLLVAAPARLALWALTRDRFYLYRLVETAGYMRALVRRA
jgi:GT2 family glycosyltransferase